MAASTACCDPSGAVELHAGNPSRQEITNTQGRWAMGRIMDKIAAPGYETLTGVTNTLPKESGHFVERCFNAAA